MRRLVKHLIFAGINKQAMAFQWAAMRRTGSTLVVKCQVLNDAILPGYRMNKRVP